ncbi:MAG: DNA methyltransferase [Gammaproteobacteria bacterium]|nr:DNA methyltransferase [Gammaproteobacteria bacterium]MDE0252142.1 DNA methyltransferase [Gammaproteobacteria bacterium]MDE0402749.1 DNA methyltransferase [Gammaproteobacteria bacterium]
MNLPSELVLNSRLQMEGCEMLAKIPAASIACTFFDPQYRGVLDHLRYGNEGKERGQKRCALKQMDEVTIWRFISELDRILLASGHLFLWIDKYHLAEGIRSWISGTSLDVVDFITWNKMKMGMGYRTRRFCEYLVVLQKQPRKAKGVWKIHTIPDVWEEKVKRGNGVHPKPVGLQGELIEAVTNTGDVVVDPAAGSFSVLDACRVRGRNFLGCDLNG